MNHITTINSLVERIELLLGQVGTQEPEQRAITEIQIKLLALDYRSITGKYYVSKTEDHLFIPPKICKIQGEYD